MHDAEYGAYETHAYEMVREWQTFSGTHGRSNVILYVIRYARLDSSVGRGVKEGTRNARAGITAYEA